MIYFYLHHNFSHKELNDELFLSMQGGKVVWSALANLYLNKFDYKTKLVKEIPKEEGILIFHPSLKKDIVYSENIKNKKLVCTLADAKDKLPFVDFHIVQNSIEEDKNSFYVTHFPQPDIIKRNKETIDTIGFKGEIQNLDDTYKNKSFQKNLQNINMKFIIDTKKEKWRDYSYIDIILAVRRKRKNRWFNKPITKLLNGWIANTPVIVSKNEIGYQLIKKSKLDFLEVDNINDTLSAIKKLKDLVLFNEMVEHGKQRAKEYSIENIVKRWIEILEEIKNKKPSLKTKLLKSIYLKGN